MRRTIGIASTVLLIACWNSPAPASKIPEGADSPEAAWSKAIKAYREGDYRAYMGTILPESHDECLCQLSAILSAAIGSEMLDAEDGLDELNEILNRYGVVDAEAPAHRADSLNAPGLWGRSALGRIRDKVGFYDKVMRYLRQEKVGPRLPSLFMLTLSDVVVNGGRATGRLSGNPRLRPEAKQATFERRGERWFVRLPPLCLNDKPPVDRPSD